MDNTKQDEKKREKEIQEELQMNPNFKKKGKLKSTMPSDLFDILSKKSENE